MPTEIKKHMGLFAAISAAIILSVAAIVFFISYTAGRGTDEPIIPTLTKPEQPGQSEQTQQTQQTQEPEPTLPQSSVMAGDFSFEDGFLVCSTADYQVGIDVSAYQEQIDWAAVKAAGVDFVMVRLGYRGYSSGGLNTDMRAMENLQGARDAGLLVGGYFFSQAISVEEAREEAAYIMEFLGDFSLDLPLAYDWEPMERTADVDGQTVTQCVIAFCDAVAAGGYEPMLYFGSHQGQYFLDMFQLTDYPWWLAWYNTEEEFYCRWQMWQYSCTGTVPGIETIVDLNILLTEESV